eukprot:GSChrysophyteH1.ASY1.ANO1.932.1 assembled CDS
MNLFNHTKYSYLFPIAVYSSSHCLYLLGLRNTPHSSSNGGQYRLVEVSHGVHLSEGDKDDSDRPLLNLHEHDRSYTREEATEYIKHHAGKKGVKCVHDRVYALFGFVPLLESFYLICVTAVDVVATIHDHDIYSVQSSSVIQVPMNTLDVAKTISSEEKRYRSLLARPDVNCVGLYFSHTYDLTSSMQRQYSMRDLVDTTQDRFLWNSYAAGPLRQLCELKQRCSDRNATSSWCTNFIQGFVGHKSTAFARQSSERLLVKYTLIARRSRFFAGTRYLRRGVDNLGNCANEVETEQLVTLVGRNHSLVLLRASIPLYWHNTNLFSPQPDIEIEASSQKSSSDMPAKKHFQDLLWQDNQGSRTSSWDYMEDTIFKDVVSVDETIKGIDRDEIQDGITHNSVESVESAVREVFHEQGQEYIDNNGLKIMQKGILRVNCVDCLDRTNIAQFVYAKTALEQQCNALGLQPSDTDIAKFNVAAMEVWSRHGNELALQYGGSDAMHIHKRASTGVTIKQHWALTGGIKNGLVAINRYVSNVSSDYIKQQGIDVITGAYVPRRVLHGDNARLNNEACERVNIWDVKVEPQYMRRGHIAEATTTTSCDLLKGRHENRGNHLPPQVKFKNTQDWGSDGSAANSQHTQTAETKASSCEQGWFSRFRIW